MNESVHKLELKTRPLLLLACLFLLFYGLGQFVICFLNIQVESYKLYTYDNSLRVLFLSLAVVLGILSCKNITKYKCIKVSSDNILYIFILVLPITLYLCFKYPWGNFGDDILIGHSFKAMFRHIYTVTSLLLLFKYKKMLVPLLALDVFLLFVDPSRVFFIETFVPKLYFHIAINNFRVTLKIFLSLIGIALLLIYIQSFRLVGISDNFILFGIFSDVMHSTYSSLQLSQFSLDNPWIFSDVQNIFQLQYGENLSPLGGFFLPGELFLSGNLFLDCVLAYLISLIATKIYIQFAIQNINIILFSGIVFIFQKFPIITPIKILFIQYLLFLIISKLTHFKIINIE
jgi:hypothetical protein